MAEIEQLKADLATLKETSKIYLGAYGYFPAHHDLLIKLTKEKIADLEAQQAAADKWADSRMFVQEILADSSFPQRLIWLARYARHLEVNVADLDHELRCERIDGGKVRDDRKAISAEKNRQTLAELVTIQNAIPPACGEAQELVQKRIEGIKMEMQNNG